MDQQIAQKVCGLVAGIVQTDGEFHPSEKALLERVMKTFGLAPEGEEISLPVVAGSEAAKAMSELSEAIRSEALELLIDAAIVDGKVVPAEQEYLAEVAKVLGIGEEQLEGRIADRLLEG